jgi:uncharacterized membrane protein
MTHLSASARLGAATGLRSMAAPAALSSRLSSVERDADGGALVRAFARRDVGTLLRLSAWGEMMVDKLPFIPARTDPGPLIGRALLGGAAGAALAEVNGESPLLGGLAGSAAAVAAAFGGYHLRRWLTHGAGLPDPVVAVCEDALAMGLARGSVRAR